jgi:hypothetical protein
MDKTIMVCDLGIDELAKKIAEKILEMDGLKLYDFGLTKNEGLHRVYLKDRKHDQLLPTYDKVVRLIQPGNQDSFLARTNQCIDCIIDTEKSHTAPEAALMYAKHKIPFVAMNNLSEYPLIMEGVTKSNGVAAVADMEMDPELSIRAAKYLISGKPSPGLYTLIDVKKAGF